MSVKVGACTGEGERRGCRTLLIPASVNLCLLCDPWEATHPLGVSG